MQITAAQFLSAIQQNVQRVKEYSLGCDGSGGKCDCIGLIIGALRLATNLIRHGMPIQEVACILGHDKLDTTMQYVVLDKTDMKNDYRKFA